jgi:hypothetical protein
MQAACLQAAGRQEGSGEKGHIPLPYKNYPKKDIL